MWFRDQLFSSSILLHITRESTDICGSLCPINFLYYSYFHSKYKFYQICLLNEKMNYIIKYYTECALLCTHSYQPCLTVLCTSGVTNLYHNHFCHLPQFYICWFFSGSWQYYVFLKYIISSTQNENKAHLMC